MDGFSDNSTPLTPPVRHPQRPRANLSNNTASPPSSLSSSPEVVSTPHLQDDRSQLPSYRNANFLAIVSANTKNQGFPSNLASPPLAASGRHSFSGTNLDPRQPPSEEGADPLQGPLDEESSSQSPSSTPPKRSRVRPSPPSPVRIRGWVHGEMPGVDGMSTVCHPATAYRCSRLIYIFYRERCLHRPNWKALQTHGSRLLSSLTATATLRCGDICFTTARAVLQFRKCRPSRRRPWQSTSMVHHTILSCRIRAPVHRSPK